MTSKEEEETTPESAVQASQYYVLFRELANAEPVSISGVSPEEIDEIEQVRRIVMETTDERPIFMTST